MNNYSSPQSTYSPRLCPAAAPREKPASATRPAARGLLTLLVAVILAIFPAGCSSINGNGFQNYIGPAQQHEAATAGATHAPTGVTAGQVKRAAALGLPARGPIRLGVAKAIVLALNNNPALAVQRYYPAITHTQVQVQRAAFDPTITGQVSAGRSSTLSDAQAYSFAQTNTGNGQAAIQEFFPTGTTVAANINTNINQSPFYGNTITSTRVGLTVTQALLQGADINANLAAIHEAQAQTRITEYQLRGLAQQITAQTEQAYWNYALAAQDIAIVQQALTVARQQRDQTQAMVRVGQTAASQIPAAQAQVALEKEALIAARGTQQTDRLALLNLVSPPGPRLWRRRVALVNKPFVPKGRIGPVDSHVDVAMRMRPDLNEARLEIQRGDLAVVQTRNGLLPVLNFFINLGKTGYANSFGGTLKHLNGSGYDVTGGLQGSYPLINRAARANYLSARLTRDQDEASLRNLEQTVQLDVQDAYITVQTDRAEIAATRATEVSQAEALRAQIALFDVGNSTSLLVAQAQSNLLSAKIGEVQAVVSYLNALAELYLLDGSLLQRRGIAAPGWAPPALPGYLRTKRDVVEQRIVSHQ